jgi:two-component system cell cycle sensor histidine kinase/response regulator CckA
LHSANSEYGAPDGCSVAHALPSKCSVPTILLVEDEAFVRQVAYEILRSAGYRVLPASNAAEAVLTFRDHSHEVQLLLTDVILPDRNGCELAHELVALGSSFKALFVSGYPENSVTRTGLQQPGLSYLPKPFSAASLLQKVKEVLGKM